MYNTTQQQKEAIMVLNFQIDDFSNPRYIVPATALVTLSMAVVIGIKVYNLPFPNVVVAIIGLIGLTSVLLMVTGALTTRQKRICAEAPKKTPRRRPGVITRRARD
jgi:hypothetical protein